jgi:hypothetical protein
MKPVVIASLALVLTASVTRAASTAPELLLRKLRALAGESSEDCGVVPLSAARDAPIRCATDAAAAGKAYRIVFELKNVDTYTWQGAARDDQGRQWVVFYDADTTSGAQASPGLGQLFCRAITYAADKDEVIDCTPSTGGP